MCELKNICDNVVSNVRALESLNITADRFGIVLTPIIVTKLPREVRTEWSRVSAGHLADLPFMLEFLEGEIKRQKRCVPFHNGAPGAVSPNSPSPKSHRKLKQSGTAAALHTRSDNLCGFCKGRHRSEECQLLPEGLSIGSEW